MAGQIEITDASVVKMATGVRLHFDKQREQWVILAPERVFVLDPVAHQVVKRCDGDATVGAIVDDLVAAYNAPKDVILNDVKALLQDFLDKRVMAT